jgi:hypothetical protein
MGPALSLFVGRRIGTELTLIPNSEPVVDDLHPSEMLHVEKRALSVMWGFA